MKKLIIPAAMLLLLTGCRAEPQKHSRDVFAMDTYMNLTAYGDAEDSLAAAEQTITALEKKLSVTDAGSEIYAANHADGQAVPISEDTAEILHMAETVSAESGGALQISLFPLVQAWGFTTNQYRVPDADERSALLENVDDSRISFDDNSLRIPAAMQIDLGALAKGYAGDKAAALLRERGITSAILNLGGNVQAIGRKPDGSKWKVGIADPFGGEELLGTVSVADCAVITSGSYERYFIDEDGEKRWHIMDPADGCPADNGLVSVTVIGSSGLRCDALSTALFVEGTEKAVTHWRSCDDFEMILVTSDENILVTEGIADDFSVGNGQKPEVLKR